MQRAIRAPSHCDFTVQEQIDAFQDMVTWAEGGAKPAGDDVLTPATVASPNYGCTFTKAPVYGVDSLGYIRTMTAAPIPACQYQD